VIRDEGADERVRDGAGCAVKHTGELRDLYSASRQALKQDGDLSAKSKLTSSSNRSKMLRTALPALRASAPRRIANVRFASSINQLKNPYTATSYVRPPAFPSLRRC
jgi:hypothetical protein